MNCIYCNNKAIAFCDYAIALEPKHKAKNQEPYKILFEDDADKERRKIHAEIRRSAMCKVDA